MREFSLSFIDESFNQYFGIVWYNKSWIRLHADKSFIAAQHIWDKVIKGLCYAGALPQVYSLWFSVCFWFLTRKSSSCWYMLEPPLWIFRAFLPWTRHFVLSSFAIFKLQGTQLLIRFPCLLFVTWAGAESYPALIAFMGICWNHSLLEVKGYILTQCFLSDKKKVMFSY